jgi:hypothetical protein
MSEVKVNKISPRTNCGTVQLGDSGDTITIPAGATIVNNGTQTGFGRTGTVDWDTTAKTASFTAVSGNGYFVNTTSGAITVTLPAGSAGDIVSLADYTNTWQTNNVTITPNGSDKIGGVNKDATLSTEGQSVTFVYVDATEGWKNIQDSTSNVIGNEFIIATGGTITTCGNCKIHTFTGPGTFCVSQVNPCAANNLVSYMVVAGGAGGGATNAGSWAAGGGGAGGFREVKSPVTTYTASPLDGYPSAPNRITVTATAFPITVGGGGAAGPTSSGTIQGTSGSNSTFSTITSAGGGGGGAGSGPGSDGVNGGSGGGSGSGSGTSRTGGTGNTPPVTPAQGFDGGDSSIGFAPAAGGGGATAVGTDAVPGTNNPRAGGAGATTQITASPVTYSAGGASGDYPSVNGTAGGNNTGDGGQGGGGGTPTGASAAGGSGIVVIRYKYQ